MTTHQGKSPTDILVVGAGPVGLTLAAELARHGARCRIIDRLAQPSPYCRAIGVTPRTLEVWDDMGIAQEMIDAGLWLEGLRSVVNGQPPRDAHVSFPDLPYSPLGIPQYEAERVLTRHLERFGMAIERGVELATLHQDESGVTVGLTGAMAETTTFRYVIGCDGAHSAVRHAVAIPFEGDAYPMRFMLGDVHIDWDVPRGMAFRALRLVEKGAPDLFVAIPLPDPGRYRVTMIAPPDFAAATGAGTDHGIQSDTRGPDLADIQAIVDDLVPGKPHLSDMRWSSLFRISMRLAARYQHGNVFIAGDAAHIHPPTGGQGMNTGIQDAYNLAWKLALVMEGAAPEGFLDSYEAERRPVGVEVVAQTRAASENFGREQGRQEDQRANTQTLISYRSAGWVRDDGTGFAATVPAAGDRAPDVGGLWRHGVGFPLRLFDILRGPQHVLICRLANAGSADDLPAFAKEMHARVGRHARIVAVTAAEDVAEPAGIALFHDRQEAFAKAYGPDGSFLVRPDGYIGWRGSSWRGAGLDGYLDMIFRPAAIVLGIKRY